MEYFIFLFTIFVLLTQIKNAIARFFASNLMLFISKNERTEDIHWVCSHQFYVKFSVEY